ncbi:transposase [Streptomyces sp. P3]|uniref:transposase n=1 Tax=Streptomyces sp. P3 TaxID=2135430 RepID=UPI00131EFBA0
MSCTLFRRVPDARVTILARRTTSPAPRKYPDELRERAIREVRATGRLVAHVAKDLGVHKEGLRQWIRQAEADAGERDDRLSTAELEELKQLRKENAESGRGGGRRSGRRTPARSV